MAGFNVRMFISVCVCVCFFLGGGGKEDDAKISRKKQDQLIPIDPLITQIEVI